MSRDRSSPLALITGASSGIGAAFAERLARDGYDLILLARRRDRLQALAERLGEEAGAKATPLVADLSDAGELSQVEAHLAGEERLALLINNAGFGGYRPFVEVDPKVIDDLIAVHIRAVTRLTRAALPGMVRRGQGAVINVASLLALSGALPPNPLPNRAVYAGAKAFIVAFTEALSGELGQSGVKVQACLPGLVDTEYHALVGRDSSKMPPMMRAADVVTAALAALDNAEVVCVPGLDDPSLIERLNDVRRTVLMSANRPALAQRYQSSVMRPPVGPSRI